ncbi:MAG: FAD-binding oxidoreductase [Chitinophagales bacterium]|nr:FAD-binding oxidoreductase [Chitinophagales bacterium]
MQLSYWEYDRYFKHIDVAIVGSGIVGLSAAFYLKKKFPKKKIVVLERSFLPYGASTRNAGFACFGSITELQDDLTIMSEDEVFTLVEKRYKGLQRLRHHLGDKNIRYIPCGGYELFTQQDKAVYQKAIEEQHYFNTTIGKLLGKKDIYTNEDKHIKKFGFRNIEHLIKNRLEGQIDTGRMMDTLSEKVRHLGVNILTGIPVDRFEASGDSLTIFANGVEIKTKQLLICTNGFAKNLLPELDVAPARAQVLVTKPIENLNWEGTFHYDRGYYYFRNIGNRILLGGGRNLDFKTEHTTEFGLTTLVQERLKELLHETIAPGKNVEIERQWSGIMGLGSSKKTIVQQVDKNVFCAVRMGGMGVALGMMIGEEAAGIIYN